jgi:uncharacterized repeat protein (TIGR01451 family)
MSPVRAARERTQGRPRAAARSTARRAALALAVACGLGIAAPAAQAAPGVPAAPLVVFSENFENFGATPTTPKLLDTYAGVTGQTYTADPVWLNFGFCNGIVISAASTDAPACGAGNNAQIKALASLLGTLNGTSPATANHVVSAYTANNPGADQIEFETATPISLPTNGRFITFSVNVAAVNCNVSRPALKFFLVDGATEIPTFTTPINPCPGTGSGTGTFPSDGAVLFTGSQLGIVMRNANASGVGNDHAFDDIKVLDATPQLDKSFTSPVAPGGTSRLTLTVTNTSELAAKPGWSFTDTLPSGMHVAATPNVADTCVAHPTVAATPGSATINVSGGLAAGEAACSVSVDVVADAPGDYANGASNIAPKAGVNLPPAPATVHFEGVPTVTITPPPAPVTVGDTPPAVFACGGSEAPIACTATVTCPGAAAVVIHNGDPLPTGVPGTCTITATAVDALGHTVTTTSTYVVLPTPDLVVVKRADHSVIEADDPITWTFTVTNPGPGVSKGVTAIDEPSQPVAFTFVKSTAGTCTSTQPVRCELGTIAPGTSVTVTLTGRASIAGTLSNGVTVTAKQGNGQPAVDPQPASNVASVKTTVRGTLLIRKTANKRSVHAGGAIGYTIKVSNPTGVAVAKVRVCDRLPPGLVFTGSPPKTTRTGGRYCASLATVKAHASKTVRIATRTLRGTRGRRTNTATVSGTGVRAQAAASPVVAVLGVSAHGGGVTG